ncbi:MAG: tetratricopeptide repeat protein [Proteobacteria bacterium]|nr:tetratricopeptide repeat protein [Pseudomonadota bacterium]
MPLPRALLQRALERHKAGALAEAEALYRQVLAAEPANADALHFLGVAALQAGRLAEAEESIRHALRVSPAYAAAHANLGLVLHGQGKHEAAIASFRRALHHDRRAAGTHSNLGLALAESGRIAEAEAAYRAALALDPGHVETHNNLGNLLRSRGRFAEARRHLDRAVALMPVAATLASLGTLLLAEGRPADAAALFETALGKDAGHAEAWNNRGIALLDLGRAAEAEGCYRRALALKPESADIEANLATALLEQDRGGEAVPHFRAALARAPGHGEALSGLVWALQNDCRWEGLEGLSGRLLDLVRQKLAQEGAWCGLAPFRSLALPTTPAEQLAIARNYALTRLGPPAEGGPRPAPRAAGGRLRVGYLSADFHAHATMTLMGDLFALHDRGAVEVFAYSLGPDDGGAERRRVERESDRFVELRGTGDPEAAARIAADRLDLLVDLKGYTRGNRARILALRPAALQVSWLGYPGTLGAGFIDYAIADAVVTPPALAPHFAEAIVRLPHCYQMNPALAPDDSPAPTRADCGLPEKGVVFCSFNNSYKITPEVFARWMAILRRVPGSALWLLAPRPEVAANLAGAAGAAGIDAGRLVLAPRAGNRAHLARLGLADLFLDTRPVGAHTTARDSLRAGVPVLTSPGETFASRVAASLLAAVGLSELAVPDLESYEELAVALAGDRERRAELRRRLAEGRAKGPLFDPRRFVRGLEAAYREMRRLHEAGERPRAITIEAGAAHG